MKYLYLIFFFFVGVSYGQQSTVDSLLLESKNNHPDSILSRVFNNLFLEYAFKDNGLAFEYLDTAIFYAKNSMDQRSLGRYYNNRGVILQHTGRPNVAMQSYLEALPFAESAQDSSTLLRIYGNMAGIYMGRQENNKAKNYFQKIIDLVDQEKDPHTYLKTLNNLGLIFKRDGEIEEALNSLDQGLKIARSLESEADIANIQNNFGLIYLDMGDYPNAKICFDEALTLNRKIGNTYQEIMNRLNLGNLYFGQKDYPKVIRESEVALGLATDHNYVEEQALANKLLYEVYKELGQIPKAFSFLEAYAQLNEEYLKDTYSKEVAELQEEFESVKNEQEIVELKQREETQAAILAKKNVQVTLGAVLFLVMSALLALVYYLFTLKKKSARELEAKNQRIETLIRELHHRVKNNLQIVTSLLNLQYNRIEDEETKQAIREGQSRLEAMSLIHKNLYLEEDLSGLDIKEYMDFLTKSLAVSYGYPVEVVNNKIELDNPFLGLDVAVPLGLIVNELASNAFKYAFEQKGYAKLILEMKEKDSKIVFRLKDNGKGLPENFKPERSPSFGLKLVTSLIKQLNSKLESSSEQGTEFVFEFVRK